jgi:SAM-dependent methyltransferase
MAERFSYDAIAERYAAGVDASPQNAFYERPAVLSVLPPLEGRSVLDVGCGSGWYAEQLVQAGAKVTAFDLTHRFVELTRRRVGPGAEVLQADLAEPLDFASDSAFDLVICPLVLHYVRDWLPVLGEFRRVLRPGGILVFSTHHPFTDWQEFQREDYFATELLTDEWSAGTVKFYRRPLSAMIEALSSAGFVVERLVEPQPTEEYRRQNPEWYDKLMRTPWFLVVRARRDG